MALLCQAINIYLLTYQHTVDHSIIHFVALHVVMEIPNLYLESLIGVKLREEMFEPKYIPKFYDKRIPYWSGPHTPYEECVGPDGVRVKKPHHKRHPWNRAYGKAGRTSYHKFGRVLYKFIRMIYVSYIFYFGPVTVLILQWLL